MDPTYLTAFEDEMSKIAGFRELLSKIRDFFRPEDESINRKVDHFFSPRAGDDRWNRLPNQTRSQKFVDALGRNPLADDTLKVHVQSLHDLSHGRPVAKIRSTSEMGKTYEVRKMADGSLGCQCGDWRYKGSVTPGYECKHISAYRSGKSRAA
jgi:hypothetical protein